MPTCTKLQLLRLQPNSDNRFLLKRVSEETDTVTDCTQATGIQAFITYEGVLEPDMPVTVTFEPGGECKARVYISKETTNKLEKHSGAVLHVVWSLTPDDRRDTQLRLSVG